MAIKLLSWNVNGMRSIARQGFADWFRQQRADVVLLQEIKARPTQVPANLLNPQKYHSFWNPAERPGYSGVAAYCKKEPLAVRYGLGVKEFDQEGRVMALEFENYILINAYFPHTRRDHSRLDFKLRFCAAFAKYVKKERTKGKTLLIGGDYNIAPTELDLKNAKSNKKCAGFLPEERDWIAQVYKKGFVDTFRQFNPGPDHYTFWSRIANARARNVGWRIDYFLVDQDSSARLRASAHQPQIMGSDHCPVSVTLQS
jgi:exodeoxyribonuclease-3